jgi:UDP-N-acetylmuramoylalanine--D-glutamate ligase
MELSDLKGKKIALLGMGLENIFLADFLINNGILDIELRDQKDLLEIGESVPADAKELLNQVLSNRLQHSFSSDYLKGLEKFDIVFRTPGLPYLTPEIQRAKESGTEISSQIKLFFDLCPAKIIGITGTKGKGTTATLISEILGKSKVQSSKSKVFLLGNIGKAAVNHLDDIKANDFVILELSSFQLQDLEQSPYVSVITNLGEDHLNYHKTLEEYWGSKANIVKYQSANNFAVINQDYLTTFELSTETDAKILYFSGKNFVDEGAYAKSKVPSPESKVKEVILRIDNHEEVVCSSDELKIVGGHNLENIAAASIVGKICGVSIDEIRKAVIDFKGLEHRLEFVVEKNGIKYFNDSFATNPVATLAAIKAFEQPVVLIIGGSEKNLDYAKLVSEIASTKNIKSVVYIGDTGKRLAEFLKQAGYDNIIPGGERMSDILSVAEEQACAGDVILLSPASASFGLFKDYKDRGERFKEAIHQLT